MTDRRLEFGVAVLLAGLVFGAYANSVHAGFVFDNRYIVLENPLLHGATWPHVRTLLQQDYWYPVGLSGLYRPLTMLSYLANYSILGHAERPLGYHVVNLLLHWGNAFLVYLIAKQLFRARVAALFGAALFAVHPITTEAVTNIVGRADLLGAASVLSGLLIYMRSTRERGWLRTSWLVALGVVATIGVFCKESAAVLPGVMLLYDFVLRPPGSQDPGLRSVDKARLGRGSSLTAWAAGYAPVVTALAVMWLVRRAVFAALPLPFELPYDNPLKLANWASAELTAIKVLGRQLWLFVWPRTLSCDYSFNQIPLVDPHFRRWEDVLALVALIAIAALVAAAIRLRRRLPPAAFFILFFLVTILPTSNLVVTIGSIMAERFLYLPSIGLAACAGLAISRLGAYRRWAPWAVTALLVVAATQRTYTRNQDWQDDVRLWAATVSASPGSAKAHFSLGASLYEAEGAPALDRAIKAAEAGLRIAPDNIDGVGSLGIYYGLKGDELARRTLNGGLVPTPESWPWYEKSLAMIKRGVPADRALNEEHRQREIRRGTPPNRIIDFGVPRLYTNLGLAYLRMGRFDEALEAFDYWRHLAPSDGEAYYRIASVHLRRDAPREAIVPLFEAFLIDDIGKVRPKALRQLAGIYLEHDRGGCAVDVSAGEPRLRLHCEAVRRDVCLAVDALVGSLKEARRFPMADEIRERGAANYRCSTAAR